MDPVERTDFPTTRRGYDPAAVAEHLRGLARRIEQLEAEARRPAGESLAAAASERVAGIVAAAEASAGELREEARHEARTHVEGVATVAAELSARLSALRTELDAVIEETGGLRAATGEPDPPLPPAATPATEPMKPAAAPEPVAAEAPEPVTTEPAATGATDEDGARLAALDLALQGRSREQAAAYLAEHFGLSRPEPLLDEVFAKAGR